MSNSVVPAAAVAHAKQLVRNKKLTKRTEEHKPARDDQQPDQKDPDAANAVQTDQADHRQASMSDTTLSSDFSFAGALATAADSSASLAVETSLQDEGGSASDDGGDGISGTVLLVGAVGLVGAGIAVLASGGGGGGSNEPPAFSADSVTVTTKEDTAVSNTLAATDPDGDVLSYSVTTGATKGTVTIDAAGKYTYTPSADFSGKDSFVVTVKDPDGATDTITVNVTVDPVNDAPRADKDNTSTLTVKEDSGPTEFIVSFTDPEGDTPLTTKVTTQPTKGVIGQDGTTYIPNANANGTDSITYTVTDSKGATTTHTINITIEAVNDAPTAAASQTINVLEDTAFSGTVVANDVDIATNGDVLTYTVSDTADHGTVTIGADGKFTYTPTTDFAGSDTFVVTIADKAGASVTQTVNVTVGPAATSIDVVGPNSTTPADFDAAGGDNTYTDDALEDTDVLITGFDEGDVIQVTGATKDEYNFSTGTDPNDLVITFVNPDNGASNLILIDDVLADGAILFNYETAVGAVGFNFMTFA